MVGYAMMHGKRGGLQTGIPGTKVTLSLEASVSNGIFFLNQENQQHIFQFLNRWQTLPSGLHPATDTKLVGKRPTILFFSHPSS